MRELKAMAQGGESTAAQHRSRDLPDPISRPSRIDLSREVSDIFVNRRGVGGMPRASVLSGGLESAAGGGRAGLCCMFETSFL